MKRILIAAFAAVAVFGIVYIGYLIFGSLNVQQIEIVGNIQQIYFVGDDINFGDAKLKVTNQDGSVRLLDLNGNVKVSLFSTSGYGKYYGTMKLTYKSQSIDVDYSVIDRTSYIIESEIKKTSTQTIKLSNATKRIIEFQKNGKCRYFEIIGGKYYLNDGNYDDSYNYQIIGDTIKVSLGDDKNYEIKTKRNGNQLNIEAVSKYYSQTNSDVINYIIETKFATTNLIKTNNTKENKTKLEIDYSQKEFGLDNTNANYVVIKIPQDKSINDSGICLKVDYDNDEIYYVYITNKMLNGQINQTYANQSFHINGYYEGREFKIFYKIV